MKEMRIFCPKCQWIPPASARWMCERACGCVWNTFETGGICPQCGKNWEDTQCLACLCWSRHADWYREPVSGAQEEEIRTLAA